jgi:hypothetical protein
VPLALAFAFSHYWVLYLHRKISCPVQQIFAPDNFLELFLWKTHYLLILTVKFSHPPPYGYGGIVPLKHA